jgi:hypothetical protein
MAGFARSMASLQRKLSLDVEREPGFSSPFREPLSADNPDGPRMEFGSLVEGVTG